MSLANLKLRLVRRLLEHRIATAAGGKGFSIISSNCVGSRISDLAGEPYLSPTVDLWFRPDDFLAFVTRLGLYLTMPLVHDAMESKSMGYPVGTLGEIKVQLMHYETFEDAAEKWHRRAARVNLSKLVIVYTDRDGATAEHAEAFDRLPHARKIMFSAQQRPELSSVAQVKGYKNETCVGNLYSEWEKLSPALKHDRLARLFGGSP